MSSSPASCSELQLENGLKVRLLHEPRLKKAAAFLRVDAGSHDVDPAWPGLAHFLEHLFFLGTERHNGDQALMAYVQRQGGQLNASTRERSADYFFEVPPTALSGALERLCDMLARPRLSAADQRKEREVLHAEFIAWSRDAEAQHQLWLTAPLSAQHPLRAFHAGNRYSLPLGNADFQEGLLAFHQRFYQAAQMTLCLVGPQSLDTLRNVAQRCAQLLPSGHRAQRPAPPVLRDASGDSPPPSDPRRLNLVFACEDLPESTAQAIDFLTTWCTNPQPGGLFAELQRRDLIEALQVKLLYHYGGQAVINFDFKLTAAGSQAAGTVGQLCLGWLEFFEALGDWGPLREEYTLLRKRQQLVQGALDLARQHIDARAGIAELSTPVAKALGALLAQLKAEHLLHPLPTAGTATAPAVHWRLPQRNRFLRPNRRPDQPVADLPAVHYHRNAASAAHEGELFVRWGTHATRHPSMARVLDRSLRRLGEEARQAGVRLTFNRLGDDWQLRLSGIAEPMPALLEQATEHFNTPAPEAWRHHEAPNAAPQAPIRELLKRLPEHCLGFYQSIQHDSREQVQPAALQTIWASARWDALAIGFEGTARSALNSALRRLPGRAGLPSPIRAPLQGRSWSTINCGNGEQALLLFCPAPPGSISDEAAWRLLAHLCQTAFYQRMRVELQLGYAVFASFRQISGRPGLVFGVQSPSTDTAGILAHIEQFLEQLPRWLTNLGSSAVMSQSQSMAARWSLEELEAPQLGETLWQARLGGHNGDYLGELQRALGALRPADVTTAAQRLRNADAGWLALATRAAPDDRWARLG